MTDFLVPVCRPKLPRTADLVPYLLKIEEAGSYSNFGPQSQLLVERLAQHVSVDSCNLTLLSSATTALLGALQTSAVDPTATWELPSWTFSATASALLGSGLKGRFVDVDLDGRLSALGNTPNLIDVLPFGDTLDLERFPASVETILVDGAASFDGLEGCELPSNKRVGVVVSLHATKALPAGEGGFFYSNDHEWVQNVRRWSNFGFWGSRESMILGTNAKMSEYAAVVGLASLDRWPSDRKIWKANVDRANNLTAKAGYTVIPALRKGLAVPYWIIQTQNRESRDSLELRLNASGVETRRWWSSGCHEMAAYKEIPVSHLEVSTHFSDTTLGLPMMLDMPEEYWRVIESVL